MSESPEYNFDETVELPRTKDQPDYSSQTKDSELTSRREVLKKGVGLGLTAAFAGMGLNKLLNKNEQSIESPEGEKVDQLQSISHEQENNMNDPWHEQNTILNLELFGDERTSFEQDYAHKAQTISEIDLGLNVCADRNVRTLLMTKRRAIRESGSSELVQLSEEQKTFCREYGVDQEVLGMCLDVYQESKEIISKLKAEIRYDEKGKLVDSEMLMINPGGMAKLIMEETSGFVNIGTKSAMTQMTQEYDKQAFVELCENLSRDTGLKFNPNNYPGSDIVNPEANFSGGAVGIQFMPSRALEYYRMFKKIGEIGNIFDPVQSIKMAWTFIACHERVGDGPNDFRWGYMRGDNEAIDLAIRKWNDLDSEVNAIKSAAYGYYDRVMAKTQ